MNIFKEYKLKKRLREFINDSPGKEDGKITQKEIAEKLNCTRQTIANYLSGKPVPSDKLYQLSKILDVSIDYLIGISDSATMDPDIKAAADYTGLSDRSLLALREYNNIFYNNKDHANITEMLNVFLEDLLQRINNNTDSIAYYDAGYFPPGDPIKEIEESILSILYRIYRPNKESFKQDPVFIGYETVSYEEAIEMIKMIKYNQLTKALDELKKEEVHEEDKKVEIPF